MTSVVLVAAFTHIGVGWPWLFVRGCFTPNTRDTYIPRMRRPPPPRIPFQHRVSCICGQTRRRFTRAHHASKTFAIQSLSAPVRVCLVRRAVVSPGAHAEPFVFGACGGGHWLHLCDNRSVTVMIKCQRTSAFVRSFVGFRSRSTKRTQTAHTDTHMYESVTSGGLGVCEDGRGMEVDGFCVDGTFVRTLLCAFVVFE